MIIKIEYNCSYSELYALDTMEYPPTFYVCTHKELPFISFSLQLQNDPTIIIWKEKY